MLAAGFTFYCLNIHTCKLSTMHVFWCIGGQDLG